MKTFLVQHFLNFKIMCLGVFLSPVVFGHTLDHSQVQLLSGKGFLSWDSSLLVSSFAKAFLRQFVD